MRNHILVTLSLLICGVGVRAQQPTLRQMASERDVRKVLFNEYAPASLDSMKSLADTVVLGTVGVARSTISADGHDLFTFQDVRVDQVLKRSQPAGLARGDVLVIRRWGGATQLEGHNVVVEENDFPQFKAGESYVLFLTSVKGESFYDVAYGPQGAFQVVNGTIRQVSEKFGTWNRDRGSVPVDGFIDEVRRTAP